MPTSAVVEVAPAPVPSQDRVVLDRMTSHEATVSVLKTIMDNTGMDEQRALSLFIALTGDVNMKRYFDGGSKFAGRTSDVDLQKLTLKSFSEHIGQAFPKLVAKDAAANIAMASSYFFEYTPQSTADVEAHIAASWDDQFLVKVDRLITGLGDFAQPSGALDIVNHIKKNQAVFAERSFSSRLAQSTFAADLAGTMLENIRRNPAIAAQIPSEYLECAVKELTEEQTLAPIAYGHHGSMTAININMLRATSVVKKPTQSDYTTIPLVISLTDRPNDEALRRLDHFGVSQAVIGFTLEGYHIFAKKKIVQLTQEGGRNEDIASLWCRVSSDPLIHQPYLLAALCNNVHLCLETSVTKPSFAFRANSSFRGEIQRIFTRQGLIPRDAIQVPNRQRKEKGKKTDPKRKKNLTSSRSSVAPTDATSMSGSWTDDTVPTTPATHEDNDKTFKDSIVQGGFMPGTALLKKSLNMHTPAALRTAMGDYLSYASVAREAQIFKANTASRSLAFSARSITRFLYDFVSDAVSHQQKGLVHETFNSIFPRVLSNGGGALESVELIMTREDRRWKKEDVRLVLARIVLAIILQTLDGPAYTLAMQGACIKYSKSQSQFRSDRATQRRQGPGQRYRSMSRNRRNDNGGHRGGYQGHNH